MSRNILILLASLILAACATPHVKMPGGLSDKEYVSAAKRQTRGTKQYDGFYQTFQADATLLTTELRMAGVTRQAEFQQWDAARTQKERDRAFQEMAAETEFFVKFYAPEADYDDLSQGNSMWKIYLDVGGKRFEGRARKLPDKLVEIKNLYPNFDRFSTPYVVSFKVPTSATETAAVKLTLTSSLGNAEFSFGGTGQ